jgi:hypothetical protein
MLFAVTSDSSQFSVVEAEVTRDLDYRSELFDEWYGRGEMCFRSSLVGLG